LGFPTAIEAVILKGEPKRSVRAGLVLPPVDFAAHLSALQKEWGTVTVIDADKAMSELMYPNVFLGYMKRLQSKGPLLRYLTTPVYFYAMKQGDVMHTTVPLSLVSHLGSNVGIKRTDDAEKVEEQEQYVSVSIQLLSVSSLKKGKRQVKFLINGVEQPVVEVKDSTGKFVFQGPMADASDPNQVACPMPGTLEKLLVTEKQAVVAGQILCTVSAMKMEVRQSIKCIDFSRLLGCIAL